MAIIRVSICRSCTVLQAFSASESRTLCATTLHSIDRFVSEYHEYSVWFESKAPRGIIADV
ncbi:uncharacterized protein BKA55DRAFT_579678 [Fusarium redolens]|uniref:Uncharacterized protein n=1 Tax=Fusarium redolens TaxID=48865 RepID=A0A9P9JWA7_FUSRE|nr:uncharacterized protein BKA55DRAFT_579678 [Fusarium redolens]KAH7234930.1 hypothetical protein BKA55DRAFT_579678 [Fusarium redolens]